MGQKGIAYRAKQLEQSDVGTVPPVVPAASRSSIATNIIRQTCSGVPAGCSCPSWFAVSTVTIKRVRAFAEGFGSALLPPVRRSKDAQRLFLILAESARCEAGARLARVPGPLVRPDIRMRLHRRSTLASGPTPGVDGVDDLALYRNQVYARLLIDLETHRLVSLLGGRIADTLAAPLRHYPGIEIVVWPPNRCHGR